MRGLALTLLTVPMLCTQHATAQSKGTSDRTVTFNVAAMNVDGLPKEMLGINLNADGREGEGAKLIGQKMATTAYDFVGLSEDFNFHDELMEGVGDAYSCGTHRGRLKASNILDIELTDGMQTDGLGLLYRSTVSAADESWKMWSKRNGKYTNGNDELIQKGYRHYTMTVGNLATVDLFEVHMDADTDAADIEARESQMSQLATDILQNYNNGRPKLIIGDTNCRYTRDYLKTKFIDVLANGGQYTVGDAWVEKCKGGSYPEYGTDALMVGTLGYEQGEVVDKIIYMNPTSTSSTKLTLNSFTVDTSFKDSEGVALSDHYPVVANFTATLPAVKGTPADHWTWKGETVQGGSSYYIYNVGFKGFIRSSNGYLMSDPNDASMWLLTSKGTNKYTVACEDDTKARLNMGGLKYESGATTFDFSNSEITDGAYKLTITEKTLFSSKTKYFNATSATNGWSANGANTSSTQNDWLFITKDQKLVYDRYVYAYNKALGYVNTLPLEDDTKAELIALINADANWTNNATVNLEEAVKKVEAWFVDETTQVQNPSFELGAKLETGNVEGWTVSSDATEAFISAVVDGDEGAAIRAFSPMDGSYVFNTWGGSPDNGYYCKQTISSLPEGYYALTATFASDSYNTVTLSMGDNTTTTPSMFDRTYGRTITVVAHWPGGDCEIAAKSSTWFEADNFILQRFDYHYDVKHASGNQDPNDHYYFSTLCLPYNAKVAAGVSVWYAKKINTETVTLETFPEGSVLAANTPVVLRTQAPNTYCFLRTDATADINNVTDNLLLGTPDKRLAPEDMNSALTYYVLANKSKGIGFYKLKAGNGIQRYRAYLTESSANASGQLLLSLDNGGETNGIDATNASVDTGATVVGIYTLGGARLSTPQRGINIVKMSDGTTKKILMPKIRKLTYCRQFGGCWQ